MDNSNIIYNFISIDIETTGLDYYNDQIIEISAYKFKNSKNVESFIQLINPHKKISDFIANLTSITNEDLKNAPSLKDIEKDFFHFIEGLPLVFHNAPFDTKFLNQKLKQPITNDILDTLILFRIANPFLTSYKLENLAKLFNLYGEHYHRASTDALVTGQLFLKLPYIFGNYSKNTIKKLKNHTNSKIYKKFFTEILNNLDFFQKNKILIQIPNNYNTLIKQNNKKKINFSHHEIFDEKGILSQKLQNFEIRKNQKKFAQIVFDSLTEMKYGIIEAGTGTGKTFGYLIPAISLAIEENKKILISTKTKALQEQLFYKDLPLLHEIFDKAFSAILIKGKTNYICLQKIKIIKEIIKDHINKIDHLNILPVFTFLEKTLTGDISAISKADYKNFIQNYLTADQYTCNSDKCPLANKCYWYNLRKQSKKSNIIITNHYLLSSEIKKKGLLFNEIKNIIIDEAHQFYEINIKNLGLSFNVKEIEYLIKFFIGTSNKSTINKIFNELSAIVSSHEKIELTNLKNKISNKAKILSEEITLLFQYIKNLIIYSNIDTQNINIKKLPLDQNIINHYIKKFSILIEEITTLLDEIKKYIPIDNINIEMSIFNIESFIKEILKFFNNFFYEDDINIINWVYYSKNNISFNITPINIENDLQQNFYNKIDHVIFLSATLSINKNFQYFKSTIGIPPDEDTIEEILHSEFDYQNQLYFILPSYLPLPDDKNFPEQSTKLISKLIKKFKKNTLILFTSYQMLYEFKNILNNDKNLNILCQTKNNSLISTINKFKQQKGSILLGTDSLWQGIDLPNDELEILIITKLPFNVPTDPIIEGKLNLLQSQNKNPFNYFYLPEAILKLKQGFGRLIRTKNDTGVVILLDKRILKSYGKYIVNSLPSFPEIITNEQELLNKIYYFFH